MKLILTSIFFYALIQISTTSTNYISAPHHNETLSRNKRFLVYPPSTGLSVMKYVGGYLGPIDIPLWQNINCLNNMQFQYFLPTSWATKFPTWPGFPKQARSFESNKIKEEIDPIKPDSTRKIAYELIEEILNKEKKNGRECILRTICEVAETPLSHNGLIGELLQTFFTPGKYEKIDDDYRYAMKAGMHHVDCLKLYPDCPFGDGVLDTFSVIHNFHFDNVLNF